MIPSRGLVPLLLVWLVIALLALPWPSLRGLWGATGLVLLVVAWWDYRAVRSRPAPELTRRLPGSMALGVWAEIRVRLRSADGRALDVEVFDHHPPGDAVEGLPAGLRVPATGWVEFAYRFRPLVRGDRDFAPAELLLTSPLALWRRRLRAGEAARTSVYPNFAEVAKYALLATDDRLSQMGILQRARRGEGLEFHQLREYNEGDSLRQVDWKATSRMRRLISREYQVERDQQIVLLLDCGRRMRTRDDEFSHFDHALDAALLLAHVALRQGDRVGLRTFGGVDRHLAPGKGAGTLRRFLGAVYDLQPQPGSPDYMAVARDVQATLRKRSLIVLVTNLRDEDLTEILPAADLLRRRHVLLLASLRERSIGAVLRRPLERFDDALAVGAVHSYLLGRRRAHDTIRSHGIQTLDVEADALAVNVVNRYLDIKRGGVL